MKGLLLLFVAHGAAYSPAVRLSRTALGRARVDVQLASDALDSAALRELDDWEDESPPHGLDHFMQSLKTGGTPIEERIDTPPPGYVPFAERADLALGTAGLEDPADGDFFDKYMDTLKRPTSVSDDHPVVLRGDQAHDAWLASLKTGGTPVEERSLTPPPGYTPVMERLAGALGVSAERVYAKATNSRADPFDLWMETRATGGTPVEERDMTLPEGHVPFNSGFSSDERHAKERAAKVEVLGRAAASAQGRAQLVQQQAREQAERALQAEQAMQAQRVQQQAAAAAPAQAKAARSAASDVTKAPAPAALPRQQQAAQAAAPAPAPQRVPAMAMSMSIGSPAKASADAESAAVEQAMRGLLAWLAQPAEARRGDAGVACAHSPALRCAAPPRPAPPCPALRCAALCCAHRSSAVQTTGAPALSCSRQLCPPPARPPSPMASRRLSAALASLQASLPAPSGKPLRAAELPPPAATMAAYSGAGAMRPPTPSAAVAPVRLAAPAPPAVEPVAPVRAAAAPAAPPRPPSVAPAPARRAAAPALGYDPEDIEPERLVFEAAPLDEVLGTKRPKPAEPLGPNTGLKAYLASLPDEDTPLPSGVEELRGYSTQYKIPGMENMSAKEYRAVRARASAPAAPAAARHWPHVAAARSRAPRAASDHPSICRPPPLCSPPLLPRPRRRWTRRSRAR